MTCAQIDAVLMHVLLNGWGWGALYETTADFSTDHGEPPAGSSATAVGTGEGCLVPACEGPPSLKTTPRSECGSFLS